VRALTPQAVTPQKPENELLKFAMDLYSNDAAEYLLTIPEVFELTAKNNYYEQNKFVHRMELRKLAPKREEIPMVVSPPMGSPTEVGIFSKSPAVVMEIDKEEVEDMEVDKKVDGEGSEPTPKKPSLREALLRKMTK